MAQVNFHVRSNRISQMEVDGYKTVGEIRELLSRAGFDVREANVTVLRQDGTAVIGHTEGYIPSASDIVRFDTETVHMPLAEKAYREATAQCPCCHEQPKPQQQVNSVGVSGRVLSIEAGDDGKSIVIRFR